MEQAEQQPILQKHPRIPRTLIDWAIELIACYFIDVRTKEPYKATPRQAEIFLSIILPQYKRVWVATTTQYGKSEITAMAILWLMATRNLIVVITAPTADKAQIIMSYVLKHLYDNSIFTDGLIDVEPDEKLRTDKSKDKLTWAHGASVYTLSSDVTRKQGKGMGAMGSNGDIVIQDEASNIPDDANSKTERMLGGNLDNSKIVKISNPFELNHFYKAFNNPDYYKIRVDYREAITEGRLTPEYVEEMRAVMSPDDFTVLYDVLFVEKRTNQLISSQLVTNSINRFTITKGTIIMGIDVARKGKDDTVFYIGIRKGSKFGYIYHLRIHGLQLNEVIGQAKKLAKKYNVEVIAVDMLGMGAGVADVLGEDYTVVPFVASERAERNHTYTNLKAEFIYQLVRDLKDGKVSLPDDAQLRKDLLGYAKIWDTAGRNGVKDADDSPDTADAMLIAYSVSDSVGEIY